MVILYNLSKNSNLFNKVMLSAIICWTVFGCQAVFGFDDNIVYRPDSNWWFLSQNPGPYVSGIAPVTSSAGWGSSGDSPLIGDVNGDGLDDIIVTRADGTYDWYAGHTLNVGGLGQIGSQSSPLADSELAGFGTVVGNRL